MKKYYRSIQNQDVALYRSLLSDDYVSFMKDLWGYSNEDVEDSINSIRSEYADYVGTVKLISPYIESVEIADLSELKELNHYLEENFSYDHRASQAVVVTCRVTVHGNVTTDRFTEKLLLFKLGGKWKRQNGHIDLSWY